MDKKTIYIGLGILAVAGIAYFLMKKKPETTSGVNGEEEEVTSGIKDGTRSGSDCWSARMKLWIPCKK